MQGDSPESNPKMQKSNPGSLIGTGYANPCLVFLEATLSGEIPVLYTCWGASSREARKPGCRMFLTLEQVILFKWLPSKDYGWRLASATASWNYLVSSPRQLRLACDANRFLAHMSGGQPLLPPKALSTGFQGAIQYLDFQTHETLLSLYSKRNGHDLVARRILQDASVDWQSIFEAKASLDRAMTKRIRSRRSVVKRLISSVFGNKPAFATA
jgi:hypothetical protein